MKTISYRISHIILGNELLVVEFVHSIEINVIRYYFYFYHISFEVVTIWF